MSRSGISSPDEFLVTMLPATLTRTNTSSFVSYRTWEWNERCEHHQHMLRAI